MTLWHNRGPFDPSQLTHEHYYAVIKTHTNAYCTDALQTLISRYLITLYILLFTITL